VRVVTELLQTYDVCPTRRLDFADFADRAGDFVLLPGHSDLDRLEPQRRRIAYLEFEEPNRFLSDFLFKQREENEPRLAWIFTLCPFTAAWRNQRREGPRRTPIFFPFNTRHLPAPQRKDIDVVYTGGMHASGLFRMAEEIAPFNYRIVSMFPHPRVTDLGVSYAAKMELIARAKVTLVHNLLWPSPDHLATLARLVPDFAANEAFAMVASGAPQEFPDSGGEMLIPQLKSRLFEAAFARSLILCRRDPWNLAERFFEPERELVYYRPGELRATLTEILARYDDYREVIERAHRRAMASYTTEAFFERYLRGLS
jgi:hypothetical protein